MIVKDYCTYTVYTVSTPHPLYNPTGIPGPAEKFIISGPKINFTIVYTVLSKLRDLLLFFMLTRTSRKHKPGVGGYIAPTELMAQILHYANLKPLHQLIFLGLAIAINSLQMDCYLQ